MNRISIRLFVTMILTIVFSQALTVSAYAAEFIAVNKSRLKAAEQVDRNALGIRPLDMTDPAHFELAKSRLLAADLLTGQYSDLYRLLELQKHQQKLPASLSYEKAVAAQQKAIKAGHFIQGMTVTVDEYDQQVYLKVSARNTSGGGQEQHYLDIAIRDEKGRLLAGVGASPERVRGQGSLVTTKISLKALKQQYPDLNMIYASSWLMTTADDGTVSSAVKLSRYPFSWQQIAGHNDDAASEPAGTEGDSSASIGVLYSGSPQYRGDSPRDLNWDSVIKVCLNRNLSDCDYGANSLPGYVPDVLIPFEGEIVIPHQITQVYASDLSPGEMPNGIDELTNIYLQEGNYGGATKQSYKSLNNQQKVFSDYVEVIVDNVNRQSIIRWNIPRDEGRFGNALWFSNIAEANWYMTFAVQGYPFFTNSRGRGPYPFQLVVSSEAAARFGSFNSPVLPKMKLDYDCSSFSQQQTLTQGDDKAQIQASMTPVYINGVRYQLSKNDFTPIYKQKILDAQCGTVNVLTGYEINIPVEGDNGQTLIFDINGRSDGKVMNLNASCGSFTASDSGDKYVISKTMATNHSCTELVLKFDFDNVVPPPVLDINIQIAEVF